MEKEEVPIALVIAAGMLLYSNTILAQSLPPTRKTSWQQLSFDGALQLLHKGNQSLKVADRGIDIACAERGELNAFWMPSLQSTGAFVYLSEKIKVKQSLSQFTDPAKDFVHTVPPDGKVISSVLDQIGTNTLIFLLAPRNLTAVDLTAERMLFTGGRRIHATRVGNIVIDLTRENRTQVNATQCALLAEGYCGLRLVQEVISVRRESYQALKLHYENTLKLEATGMIDKATRLFAQVNMNEALRRLETACKEEAVVRRTLKTLFDLGTSGNITPSSPLSIDDTLPPEMESLRVVGISNYLFNQLNLQKHIAKQQVRTDQSGCLSNTALLGKQTLYSHGIQSNLLSRIMIGVGFTQNLFDGLERGKRIRQSRLTQRTLVLGQEKARDDLSAEVDKLYTGLRKALDNMWTLNTTIELGEELTQMRKKAFTEGTATSTEVVDAETLLSKTEVAGLAAYYEYDVTLMNLLALRGIPEQFGGMKGVTSLPITENRRNKIEIE